MTVDDLKVDMIVETLMCVGRIASDVKTKTRWQRARVTAIVKRKSKDHPHGHIKIDVLKWFGGGVEVSDEIGLHELNKYVRLPIKYVAAEPPPMDLSTFDPFATIREAIATAWLDEIVRELGVVRVGPTRLPEGEGFEASIDVPELGDYATGFGLDARTAIQEAARNARNKDVRK